MQKHFRIEIKEYSAGNVTMFRNNNIFSEQNTF